MKSFQSAITVLLFAALVAGVYMWAVGDLKVGDRPDNDGNNNSGFLKTEGEFRRKLAELRIEQDKVGRRKILMEERKAETVAYLKEKGITSTSNLDDKDVKYAVKNLKQTVSDIKGLDKIVERYEEGIVAIEAMLKQIEQERISAEVALSDEQAEELNIMIRDLDEKLGGGELDLLEDDKLRELLDLELGE